MAEDIRKTGVVGLKGLKGIDHQQESNLPTLGQITAINRAYATGSTGVRPIDTSLRDYEGPMAGWGSSKYDNPIINTPMSEGEIQDTRYENQPWYDVLANGIGKMFGTAGTTLVSSLIGLPYGLYEAANQGRWSALWDNDVTEAMANVDDWMEKNMTNYQSQAQQQDPRFRLGDMNWWADNFIKNVGFTLGAAASMAVGSGSVGLLSRSLGFVNEVGKGTKMGTAALSALFAATGEGMIEARQGVDARNKLETQRLENALTPYYNALQMQEQEIDARYAATGDYDTYMKEMNDLMAQRQLLEERKQAGLQQIEESGLEMGNTILLANQGLLTAGNLIQFGKGIVKSFDKARHAAEVSSKTVKPSWVRAVRAKGENPLEGLYTVKGKKLGLARAALKGLVVEGSEEMNQEWIQQSSGAAFNEQDVNDYWKARLDPDSYRDTTEGLYTLGQVLDRGFKNSWGDIDQWEQFLIGGLTGMGGTYMPTRLFNQDKTKSRFDPRRYGSWEGGVFREIPEFNRQYRQYQENIDEVNKILQSEDFPARMLDMVGHTYTEDEKQAAVEADNKKAWKDADDKQFVHDVQSFLRAGKLDDLRAIYDYIGKDMSDEDIDNLIKHTTKHITAAEDKQNHDAAMDELIAAATTPEEKARLEAEKQAYTGRNYDEGAFVDRDNNKIQTYDEIRKELKHNSEKLHQKLDSYLESIDTVNKMTNGRLSKDQEDNLVYLHHLSKESTTRFDDIMSGIRKQLPSKFLLKTSKTPEQLSEQFASSDLAFSKDEKTKKGYVEVDTSMMNDKTFGIFFVDTILGGENIETENERQAERDSEEQLRTNEQLIKKAFVDDAMINKGKTLAETLSSQELKDFISAINDASLLRSQASQFYNTYLNYMLNPEKIEQDKKAEVDKAAEKQKQDALDKSSLADMLDRDMPDLADIIAQSKKGKNKAGGKAAKAASIKETEAGVSAELEGLVKSGKITGEEANDVKNLLNAQVEMLGREEDSLETPSMKAIADRILDTDTEAMISPENMLTDEARAAIDKGLVEVDDDELQARNDKARDIINSIKERVAKKVENLEDKIDKGTFSEHLDDEDKTAQMRAQQAEILGKQKERSNPSPSPRSQAVGEEPAPLITAAPILTRSGSEEEVVAPSNGEGQACDEDMINGQQGKNIPATEREGWHPWRTSTSEVGYYGNAPWTPSSSDPFGEIKKKRYDAVRKKLLESGAYERRRKGLVKPGMTIGFKVFQDVNDEAGDFVIFYIDKATGAVLGDLPSLNASIDHTDIPMNNLYEAIQKEWDDADDDDRKEGMESKLTTEVDHVLVGKVLYQTTRQSVKELTDNTEVPPLFAIKYDSMMITGTDGNGVPKVSGVHIPRSGNDGQPYVLIQTPNKHSNIDPQFKYYAVPIITRTIGELDDSSMFIQILKTVLDKIKHGEINDFTAKRLLQSLIAVGNVHVNLETSDGSKKGTGIRVTTFNRVLGAERHMPYTIFEGRREDMDIDTVLRGLSRFQVNVSADFINGNDGSGLRKYLTIDGKPISGSQYNEMLAEVSTTFAAKPETVNDWFTVRPLVMENGQLVMGKSDDSMPTWDEAASFNEQRIVVNKGGKQVTWTVKPNEGYRVYDENGNEIILFDTDTQHSKNEQAEAARIAAEVYGKYTLNNREEPYAAVLAGITRIYDPKTRTFHTQETLDKEGYDYNTLKAIREDKNLSEQEKAVAISAALGRRVTMRWAGDEAKTPVEDHTEEVMKLINEMREDASHYHLVKWDEAQQKYVEDPEGDYYIDDRNNNIHARVSNVVDADEDVIEAYKKAGFGHIGDQLKTASTGAGNVVDRFIRGYFRNGDPLEGLDLSKEQDLRKAKDIAAEVVKRISSGNITIEDGVKLCLALHDFKHSLGPDWVIDSTGFVASGVVSFDGSTAINVAGTIDLFIYNPKKGQFGIIDMKSSVVPLFTKEGDVRTDVKTQAKMEHWRGQQTLYRTLLGDKFKIIIGQHVGDNVLDEGLRIMFVGVDYSTSFNETDYTMNRGVLLDRRVVVNLHPTYGKVIPLRGKKNVKYNTGQLPESVKRLMPNHPVSRLEDEEVEVGSQLIALRDSVPEGSSLHDFIRTEYKDNQDVKNLVSILEENRESSKPVMTTKASKDLLLKAVDTEAMNKAMQEAEALKHDIVIDIPQQKEYDIKDAERDLVAMGFDSSLLEELKKASEDLVITLAENSILTQDVLEMSDEGADTKDIITYIRDNSQGIRHRKATEGSYKKLDLDKEMRWLTKNLPQISKARKLQIIKGLIACSDGSMDFGRVQNGIMMVGTEAGEGTMYHEAFHYVVQFLMTDEEIESLFKAAVAKYGKMPLVALEERLADDFAYYTLGIDPEESKIKKFFRELWNAIKAMLGRKSYIETLFRSINTGVYSGREFRNDRSNAFSSINNEQREVSRNYEYLTDSERERVRDANIDIDTFNGMTKDQQEYMLHCVI